ncbi:hypothetical protein NA645_01955 [Pseudomonas stutzeri]|uniref:hypothetical protein n=1 Tax=Stutzerimonas stutzeri TaxID=316 RepID=UPI00210CA7E1|nr:hypothetical protein [Stutzerimonas stutzeri]MCQ4306746.1 hypothetical protein [Stutzerimonas stutzeri]
MARDKYIFKDSSRVYKQACAMAGRLRNSINGSSDWFSEAAQALDMKGLTSLHCESQWVQAIELAKSRVDLIAASIDPRIAVPALLQAVDEFYYIDGEWRKEVPFCGSAIKASIAMIWPNRSVQAAIDKSAAQVIRLVSAVMAWEQLVAAYEQYKVFRFDPVTFHRKGFRFSSDRDNKLRADWNDMARPCGINQRTLEQSKAVIFRAPGKFYDAVKEVLAGREPNTIQLFTGTVFENAGNNPDFWLGLNARLLLMFWAGQFKKAGMKGFGGVVLFEEFASAATGIGFNPELAQKNIEACFWQKKWYDNRVRGFPSNMLVERPVLRIDNKTFATTIPAIMDSINCYVEHSVFRYEGYGGVPVDAEAFRLNVSMPFEKDAVHVFCQAGWKASGVSHSGYWAAGGCQLTHPDGSRVPGEIDVLALHPSGLVALVVECKVLSQPLSMSKLKNIVGKLGEDDQEGFHANLEKKTNWLSGVPALQGALVEGALLVDQGCFLGADAKHPVLNLERLRTLLVDLNEEIDSYASCTKC